MKVTSIRTVRARAGYSNKVKAYVTLEFYGLEVDNFRIVYGSQGHFVGWPTKMTEIDGEKKYIKTVRASEEIQQQIDKCILDAYYQDSASRGAPIQQPPKKQTQWIQRGQESIAKQPVAVSEPDSSGWSDWG